MPSWWYPALFVHPLHRGIDCVARDPMQAKLTESEPGPHPHRVGGVPAPPRGPLADHEPARSPAISPVDAMQTDKADMSFDLIEIAQTRSLSRRVSICSKNSSSWRRVTPRLSLIVAMISGSFSQIKAFSRCSVRSGGTNRTRSPLSRRSTCSAPPGPQRSVQLIGNCPLSFSAFVSVASGPGRGAAAQTASGSHRPPWRRP